MNDADLAEYADLINLWNCTEPMTPAQLARLAELEAMAVEGMKEKACKAARHE